MPPFIHSAPEEKVTASEIVTHGLLIFGICITLPFSLGPLLLWSWLASKKDRADARFSKNEVDACMGRETHYLCSMCGSLKVQNHSARDAGFKEDFSPEWFMSQRPCSKCKKESEERIRFSHRAL